MATITTQYVGDMLFETQIGSRTLTIDVPAGMGGSDRGPMPPQLFIASLGSCVAALVAEYCENHNLDATGLSVNVDFEKGGSPTRLKDIEINVNLPHVEVGKREGAIRRVAEHCPVHETILTLEGISMTIHDASELMTV